MFQGRSTECSALENSTNLPGGAQTRAQTTPCVRRASGVHRINSCILFSCWCSAGNEGMTLQNHPTAGFLSLGTRWVQSHIPYLSHQQVIQSAQIKTPFWGIRDPQPDPRRPSDANQRPLMAETKQRPTPVFPLVASRRILWLSWAVQWANVGMNFNSAFGGYQNWGIHVLQTYGQC